MKKEITMLVTNMLMHRRGRVRCEWKPLEEKGLGAHTSEKHAAQMMYKRKLAAKIANCRARSLN